MRLRNPALVHLAGRACGTAFKTLFTTLKKTIVTPENVHPYDAHLHPPTPRYIFSAWHDSAILAAFGGSHSHTIALTSMHRDGAFVVGVLRSVSVETIRGSSGRGGRKAAKQILSAAKTHDIIITPDGPRGPRRQISSGIVYLASRSGNAIVPTAFACSNAWEIQGSWTTQTIPKPFSKVALMADHPVAIPRDLDRSGIEDYRCKVQVAMDAIQERADSFFMPEKANLAGQEPVLGRC